MFESCLTVCVVPDGLVYARLSGVPWIVRPSSIGGLFTYADARSVARSAPTRPPSASGGASLLRTAGGTRSRHERSSEGRGPAPNSAVPKAGDAPPAPTLRPPSPLRAASHRRGSTLTTTFRDLGILPETAEALEAVGIIHPVPHPGDDPPGRPHRHDVIGQAKTGTGKTLGFGLPLLERVVVPADVEAGRATPEQLDRRPAGARRRPDPRAVHPGHQRPADRRQGPQRPRPRHLRRPGVRAAGRGAARRASTSSSAPRAACSTWPASASSTSRTSRRSSSTRPTRCSTWASCPTSRRSCTMLPAKRQTMLFSATMPGAGHRPRPPLHDAADAHPRHRAGRRGRDRGQHHPARLPRALAWTSPRWSRGSCRPRAAGSR